MELISTPWHIISASLVFLSGLLFCVAAARFVFDEIHSGRAVVLYLWHTMFCVMYIFVGFAFYNNLADAGEYYRRALYGSVDLAAGTEFVVYLTHLLVRYLGLSILGVFLVYNIFGSVGLLAFDASLRAVTYDKADHIRYVVTLIIFLPSISFWSSAIGKDSIAFMAIGLMLWASLDFLGRKSIAALSLLSMFAVRPHIAAVLIVSFSIAIVFNHSVSITRRSFAAIVGIILAINLVPFSLGYAGLRFESDAANFFRYVELRQSYNLDGGSSINIASMSLPSQLFAYAFRPLPNEAHTTLALWTSIENIFLLILFTVGVWDSVRHWKSMARFQRERSLLWLYALTTWTLLALTTANLGIASRQKWMFLPALLLLLVSAIGQPRIEDGCSRAIAPNS